MTIATLTREKKKRGFASLLNQFGEPHAGNQLMGLAPIAEPQAVNLTEKLNAMIVSGASFDVGTDDFQVCGANYLTQAEKDFLTINEVYILCTLQQALLMKYLPTNLIPDYICEINERLAITADGGKAISTEYFEIVREITAKWFARLRDTIPNLATAL